MGKKKKDLTNLHLDLSNLKFYYGIPHCHTILSTGRGSPIEALEYGRHNGIDFMIITDHNGYLLDKISDKDSKLTKWQFLLKSIEKFNKKHDDFVGIAGFETHSDPWGDLNIINSNTYFRGTVNDINSLMLWLLAHQEAIVSINHPHKYIDKLTYNPYLNDYLKTIEVGNGSPPHKYVRYDKYYFSLLDKGWKIGAINSQDNHRINFGESENLTGIITNKLDVVSIIDAFKNYRTFSTESKTLKLYFTINSCFMGSTIECPNKSVLNFYIYAEDSKRTIQKIEIISKGGTIIKMVDDINLSKIKYMYSTESSGNEGWYIIKIYLTDNKQAMSSPIFIK